jgi:SAM-dependent methyltransferase
MYSGSKESGAIVGRIQDAEAFDLADIAENTACEESLVCADAEGNPMTLSSCLDPETGALSWVPEEDQATVNARVLGCNLMPSMLHDADRNGVFEAAITRMISYFKQHEGRAPVVLDIGAGTGLLSMMAAKAGASSVIGCEMFDTMARAATEVVQDNALADTVQIVEAKSTDLEQGLGADLLVSELLDSALLGESVMFSHADAVQRLLAAPGGPEASLPVEHRVLPHSAHVYCTLVQSDELQNMHDVSGLCFGADANATRDAAMQPGEEGEESKGVGGTPWRNPWAEKCRGGWALLPLHWKSLKARTLAAAAAAAAATTSKAVQVELSLAAPVLSFEFFHAEAEGGADHCYDTDIQVTAAGRVTGLLFYWYVRCTCDDGIIV